MEVQCRIGGVQWVGRSASRVGGGYRAKQFNENKTDPIINPTPSPTNNKQASKHQR